MVRTTLADDFWANLKAGKIPDGLKVVDIKTKLSAGARVEVEYEFEYATPRNVGGVRRKL